MNDTTTIQGLVADLNEALDLPYRGRLTELRATELTGMRDHAVWRISGPAPDGWSRRTIASGLDEATCFAILSGMVAALDIAAMRDRT